MSFQGRRASEGERYTLTLHTPPDATADDRRRAILRVLGFGLVRFAAETPAAERLRALREGAGCGVQLLPLLLARIPSQDLRDARRHLWDQVPRKRWFPFVEHIVGFLCADDEGWLVQYVDDRHIPHLAKGIW